MKAIFGYVLTYTRSVNRYVFLFTSLLTAALITINYTAGIEPRIVALPDSFSRFLGFFLLFIFIFSTAWLVQFFLSGENIIRRQFFYLLLLCAPAIFAAKVTLDWLSVLITQHIAIPWNEYWQIVLNWPLKCLFVMVLVALLWRWGNYEGKLPGMQLQSFRAKPYLLLLLGMVPLIILAATRPDFQHTYPKIQQIGFIDAWTRQQLPYKLLFEISYGIDFITIELFFRGFLVLAFIRYAGKDAILPMAAFYCSIHFGKPLFECITSYFGGIVLGAIVLNTRTIWGGLIIHLGIAWLMEIAGYLSR
jgi:hypothetical protein